VTRKRVPLYWVLKLLADSVWAAHQLHVEWIWTHPNSRSLSSWSSAKVGNGGPHCPIRDQYTSSCRSWTSRLYDSVGLHRLSSRWILWRKSAFYYSVRIPTCLHNSCPPLDLENNDRTNTVNLLNWQTLTTCPFWKWLIPLWLT